MQDLMFINQVLSTSLKTASDRDTEVGEGKCTYIYCSI